MKTVPLRRLATIAYGDALPTDERVDGGVPVFSSGGLTGKHDRSNTSGPVIVVGRKGSHGSLWWSDTAAFVIDTAYAIDESMTPTHLRWLYYALATLNLRNMSSDVGVPGLARERVYEAAIPDGVSLEDQRRVAAFLDEQISRVDGIIAGRVSQMRTLKELLRSERRLATTGSDRSRRRTGVVWMPEVAADWPLRKVSWSFRTGSGTTPKSDRPEYFGEGVPWVNTADLRDGDLMAPARSVTHLAIDDYPVLRVFQPGALVVAMYGATIGRAAILRTAACVNQACCVLEAREHLQAEFAFHWFVSHRDQIVGLASGSGQPNISQEVIRSLRIPSPPAAQQDAILRRLRELSDVESARSRALDSSVQFLTEYKQALITAAVTGELDVTTASREIPA